MPELPEVETTRLGVLPHVKGKAIAELIVRRRDLRQPITKGIRAIEGRRILDVKRRSKYLLFELKDAGHLLIHLGMSGSLRITKPDEEWRKHDHVGITVSKTKQLRFHDPRRFGLMLWIKGDPMEHDLLKNLGPEPLSDDFTVDYLKVACAKRSAAIKLVVMDAKVIVGVGNIYASESLFRAGISPGIAARRLSKLRLAKLVEVIREVLTESIEQGGTTLRDFVNSEGNPGYFRQRLFVYGRDGMLCRNCGERIKHRVMGQRATYWCPKCQS